MQKSIRCYRFKHCQVLAHTDRFGYGSAKRCQELCTLTGLGELRQGLKRIAPDGEKYTKPKGKERPTEAPLPFKVLLFFIIGTMSGKPVAALNKMIE